MFRGFVKSLILCLTALLLTLAYTNPASAQSAAPAAAPAPVLTAVDGNYKLSAGDKVNITVFDEPTMSGEFVVSSSGDISYPLIGNINAQGMTLDEFQAALIARLMPDILKNPKVTVSVLNYRPYYILGEVNAPGEYPYTDNLNVMNAVAKASGFTYRAKTTKVFIRRAGENTEKVYDLTSDLKIAPGDTIRVAERYF